MYSTGCYARIRTYISYLKPGEVFAAADLEDLGSATAIRKALSRFCEDKGCIRIMPGIYRANLRESDSDLSVPSIDIMANAIARNKKWKITPNSELARFWLKLSQETPTQRFYYSTGPSTVFPYCDFHSVEFKHISHKFLQDIPYPFSVIVSALLDVQDTHLLRLYAVSLSDSISDEEKIEFRNYIAFAPARLRKSLERICAGVVL